MVALLPLLLINDAIAAYTTVTLRCAFIAMMHVIHWNRVRTSDALERVQVPHSVLLGQSGRAEWINAHGRATDEAERR